MALNAKLRLASMVGAVVSLALTSQARAGNLPLPPGEARTPMTRTLSGREAAQVLERDWLFQAMGEPLLERASKEIVWTRQLAERLARQHPNLNFVSESNELEELAKKLAELRAKPAPSRPVRENDAPPRWVWYPEGRPVEDAPAEARYFRARFTVGTLFKCATTRERPFHGPKAVPERRQRRFQGGRLE